MTDSKSEDAEAVQSLPQMAGWNLNLIDSFHSVSFAEPTVICCSRSQSSHTVYVVPPQSVKLSCNRLSGEFSAVIMWFKVAFLLFIVLQLKFFILSQWGRHLQCADTLTTDAVFSTE